MRKNNWNLDRMEWNKFPPKIVNIDGLLAGGWMADCWLDCINKGFGSGMLVAIQWSCDLGSRVGDSSSASCERMSVCILTVLK